MKKFVLFFALLWMCDTLAAQEYEMHIKVRLKYRNNSVTGNSFFRITFVTDSTQYNWQWQKRAVPGKNEWAEYEKTFRVEQKHLVKQLQIHTKREYNGGNDGGEGDASITILPNAYPCSDSIIDKKLVAFDGVSTVQITIKPLSLPTNRFAILTEAHIVGNDDLHFFRYTIHAIFSDNSKLELEPGSQRDIGSRTDFLGQALVLSPYSTRKRIKEIEVISRIEVPWIGTISETKTIGVDDNLENDLVLDLGNAFHFLDATSHLKIRYYRPQTPIVSAPEGNTFLPSDNKISLNVSEINNEVFDWKYRINTFGTFQDLPTQFGTDQIISLSGKDLFGANWESQLFKSVQFKAIYTCPDETRESEIITLTHLPSAPGIVSTEPVVETCAGSNDGKIRIKFDRPLYNNELFYVFLNEVQFEALPQTMDGNNILTIENLVADTYDVSLLSTFGSKGNGYSDGINHKAKVVLLPRPAITNFAAPAHNVHCYNGEDGAIDVKAQGGTSLFTATLWQGGSSLKTISFADPLTGSFAELAAGTYSVTLKDSNGCDPKDGSNSVITLNPEVAQPAKGVVLSTVESVEPLGFGLTDGHITMRAEAGTYPFTFSWTDENNETKTPQPSVSEGSSMTSTLSLIGKGSYHIIAHDNQFALVTNPTPVNIRGCFDSLTVLLDQPPLLEVKLKEKRYVSCYGDHNGQIAAIAGGGRPYAVGHALYPYRYAWFTVNNGELSSISVSDSVALQRPAAVYRVSVTDRNGITAWSPDFLLVQPDAIAIQFNTPVLLCDGDSNGISEAAPVGGTPPFTYAWSTDATTSAVSGLSKGLYSLVVTDIRGCTHHGFTEVIVPNSIDVEPVVTAPSCNGFNDGSIQLLVNGGVSPYSFAWDSGETSDNVVQAGHGEYSVRITDHNGCFIDRTYFLENPALAPLDLGPDRVLCTDQTLLLDATHEGAAQYSWTKNGVVFSDVPVVELDDAGHYAIKRIDVNGCANTDEIKIERIGSIIDASLIVASRGPQNERIRVANISHPAPERAEWILPDKVTVLEETPGYVDILFNEKGEFDIGLKGFAGPCEATAWSKIKIVDKAELADYQTPSEPFIRQFMVTPNPNDGKFQVVVELKETSDFSLVLTSMHGVTLQEQQFNNQNFVRVDFDVKASAGKGLYVLQLITNQGYSVFKIVIE